MHAVAPKLDCPHLVEVDVTAILQRFSKDILARPCASCQDFSENWMCLQCEEVYCSRYVQEHMLMHGIESEHRVVVSFSDASFWCYGCESYIYSPQLGQLARKIGKIKFPEGENGKAGSGDLAGIKEEGEEEAEEEASTPATTTEADANNSTSAGEEFKDGKEVEGTAEEREAEEATRGFSFDELVSGLREKRFQRVCFLTGAGISVAAGIPDFRTPGTGLYSKLAGLGLPYPEAIFSLDYLHERPFAFYSMANGFLTYKAYPVQAHHFMSRLEQEGMLQLIYTQNIDGLELDAGVPLDKVVQAHGHMRSAHCVECRTEAAMEDFFAYVEKEEVLYCSACKDGVVKPDIVFFGENLPPSFSENFMKIGEADLVIVMGTSLQVWPFAALVPAVPSDTPVVLLNRENPGLEREKLLFVAGDIEESVRKICAAVGWQLPASGCQS